MNYPVSATILDIVFIIFTILMVILGYKKGIIVRLYNVLATFLAFTLSLFLSEYLSDIIELYKLTGMFAFLGAIVNRMFVFGIVFVIIKVLFVIIGKFVKPVLKSTISKIPFIRTFNSLLGAILSFIEVLFISYFLLLVSVSPLYNNGKEIVNETMAAKQVLRIAPAVSNRIMQLTDDFRMMEGMLGQDTNRDRDDSENISTILSMLSGMQDLKLLSPDEIEQMAATYMNMLDNINEPIVIDRDTYNALQELLDSMDDVDIDTDKINGKIIVSE